MNVIITIITDKVQERKTAISQFLRAITKAKKFPKPKKTHKRKKVNVTRPVNVNKTALCAKYPTAPFANEYLSSFNAVI